MKKYKKELVHSFKVMEKDSRHNFEIKLREILKQKIQDYEEVVILCIGSDIFVGDCLGPFVGHKLFNQCNGIDVYGTFASPVTANSLKGMLNIIYQRYRNPLIIAIDSALGANSKDIGNITLSNAGIFPGEGFGETLPYVGDISITGTVSTINISFEKFMQTVRMNLVLNLVNFIANGLINVLCNINLLKLSNNCRNIISISDWNDYIKRK